MWLQYVSYFFGGAFLTNGIPHFVTRRDMPAA